MPHRFPTPPANLSTEIVNTFNEATSEHLRDVASYAEALARHKDQEAHLGEEAGDTDIKERSNDLPDDVATKSDDQDQGDQ